MPTLDRVQLDPMNASSISVWIAALFSFVLYTDVFALTFKTQHHVADAAVGDVNGDGIADIVTCGNLDGRSSVDVLLGKGDGTFSAPIRSSVGAGPGAIALADFNLDGIIDVATANFGLDSVSANTVSIFLGYGDGTFQNQQTYHIGGKLKSIATADLNGDSFPDIVVGETSRFVVLLGGARGFILWSAIDLPDHTESITLGDADCDGKLDIFAGNSVADAVISRGNGDGTFQPRLQSLGPYVHILVMDLNGDGFDDLVKVVNYATNNWNVALNNGHGKFGTFFGGGFTPGVEDSVAGDFNADGKIDVAFCGGGVLIVFLGNGD